MHARAVEDARARLCELRREEWQDLALAGAALAFSLAATQRAPSLALPLFVGGLALGLLGIRALWRHWDLVDRLAGEPNAYTLAEVLAYASRETTMERRRTFAALIRSQLAPPRQENIGRAAEELAALADELEDESLDLTPECGVACSRLLTEPAESPLLDPRVPQDGLHSSVRRIRSGFTAR